MNISYRKPRVAATFIALLLAATLTLPTGCGKEKAPASRAGFLPVSHRPEREAAASPRRCVACHESTVAEWQRSHHAIANRPIRPEVDAPHFAQQVADPEKIPYRPIVRDEQLTIANSTADATDELPAAEGVIGATPLIQYLIPAQRGRWQAHSLAFDPSRNEWFDVFENEERSPGEWGHWSGQGMNWNANCAVCHMTEFQKNYNVSNDRYNSEWTAHGISCLQCHGNSLEHAAAAERGEPLPAGRGELTRSAQMENCASCHSRREELTPHQFRPGDRFHDHFRLTLPDTPGAYFPDHQAREEDFVYGSFMLSKMGNAGVSCLDCHNPHSGELVLPTDNNALCMQCHDTGRLEAPIIVPTEHSHHPAASTGNRCIECHMPARTYMARDPRRDHGFTSPDPGLTLELGVPNACSQCHKEESVEWAAETVESWYDVEALELRRTHARMMAQAFAESGPDPAAELAAAAHEATNPFWRATYLRLLSGFPATSEVSRLAEQTVAAPNSTVRAAGVQLLALDPNQLPLVRQALTDPTRDVRLQAAEALYSREPLPSRIAEEWATYIEANADRPHGRLRLAEMSIQDGDAAAAEAHLRQALRFDASNPQLYFDGAILLSRANAVDRAFALLRMAPREARDTGLLAYADGLLSAERGHYPRAIEQLEAAVASDPRQTRWWYNLALAYAEIQDFEAARHTIERGLSHAPRDSDLINLRNYFQASGAMRP